jgi:hypothetical protein
MKSIEKPLFVHFLIHPTTLTRLCVSAAESSSLQFYALLCVVWVNDSFTIIFCYWNDFSFQFHILLLFLPGGK